MRILKNALKLSHDVLKDVVKKGDIVVDATCGKGNDTVFLAKLVQDTGKVYAFDIQKKAIDITRQVLKDNDVLQWVNLIHDGHENMDLYVKEDVSAVIFNLGYLPTGNHNIATTPATTIMALKKALDILKTNGLVVMVVYSGGDSGFAEKESVLEFVGSLNAKQYNVMKIDFVNQINNPPVLVCIEKIN